MPVVNITEEFLKSSLTCPTPKTRIEYCDGGGSLSVSGLYVEVRATSPGQGTYYLRYKDANGKTCHQKIGRTTDIDLDQARTKAKELRAQIALGGNPREAVKAVRAMPTFSVFFEDQYLPYAKQRKRTWDKDDSLYRMHLKAAFGALRLNRITRSQIQALHTGLRDSGLAAATCDHYVKLLRRVLNLAVEWGMLEKNPAHGFPLFREDNKVEHYLDAVQLQRLLQVLRTDSNRTVCHIALFLLSTGARLGEALNAQWRHIDRAHRVWYIPAANSKSKKGHSVPLNAAAIEVLDGLNTEGRHDHLFINRTTKKPYTTIHKVWERLRLAAGLPHLRVHDLRHTYASLLVNSGRTLYEVQHILGHSDPSVTQRYAHLSTKALQEAADTVAAALGGGGEDRD